MATLVDTDTPTTTTQHSMATLGKDGDTVLTWDPDNAAETENARRTFFDMVNTQRFLAFAVDEGGGGDPEQIREFDPEVKSILLTPPMMGG